jgi:putative peptidoglycan lipid II flippase
MLQQVPETLIGTAIGTAMLPALAELAAREDVQRFQGAVDRATRVLIGLTLPVAAVVAAGVGPLLQILFKFDAVGTPILLWTTRAFLVGLVGHSLLEVAARSFYARQDARTPLIASGINMLSFIVLGILLFRPLGPAGIALSDALAWTGQAAALLYILGRRLKKPIRPGGSLARAALAGLLGAGVTLAVQAVSAGLGPLVGSVVAMGAGALAALPVILPEIKLLFRL